MATAFGHDEVAELEVLLEPHIKTSPHNVRLRNEECSIGAM